MIIKDLNKYAKDKWSEHHVTIAEASKINDEKGSLVLSDEKVYCFDDICKDLFDESHMPATVDGVYVYSKGNVELIEFKSGFKKNITKENFSEEKGWCKPGKKVCKEYWELFFKNQEKETSQLIASIRDKAIESYIAFEKHIFPECSELNKKVSLKLIVVIDGDEVDSFEDSLADVSGKKNIKDSQIGAIRSALKRLVAKTDALGNPYYYDGIVVMTAHDFKHYIDLKYKAERSA